MINKPVIISKVYSALFAFSVFSIIIRKALFLKNEIWQQQQ